MPTTRMSPFSDYWRSSNLTCPFGREVIRYRSWQTVECPRVQILALAKVDLVLQPIRSWSDGAWGVSPSGSMRRSM
jgi:hypothetical protein